MDNLEAVLQSLNDFERAKEKSIGPELDQLLSHIAKTGRTEFPWHLLKPLIAHKLEKVLEDFFENTPSTNALISEPTSKPKDFYPDAQKLISILNCFVGTPFTIQRICELITEPKRYYKTKDKFLRGVEKNIMVVSTVQPDGLLITRSVASVLTNGDMSPTKIDTAPASPNITPLNNWLLSCLTNSPDTALNPTLTSPEIAADEKPKTQSSEESSVDTNTFSNMAPNSDDKTEQLPITDEVPASENAEDASRAEEDIIDKTNKDNAENCVENGTNGHTIDATEKADALVNIETPSEEKSISENDRMEES